MQDALLVVTVELNRIKLLQQSYIGLLARQKSKNTPPPDTWDIDARDTLRDITSLGYGELGQSNLESLMRGLRARDGNQ